MTDTRSPGSSLLLLIDKIRAERRAENVTLLSDAELLCALARDLGDGDDHFRRIACTLAINRFFCRDEAEVIAAAGDLLNEIGLEFSPKQLLAVLRSDALRELQRTFRPGNEPPNSEERLVDNRAFRTKLREVALTAGAVAFGGTT